MEYSLQQYWNDRYASDTDVYEWLQNYKALRKYFHDFFIKKPGFVILNVGNGNSEIPKELNNDGFDNLFTIDVSNIVINQMLEKYQGLDELKWQVMDCRKLEYDSESFSAVFDKACLDSLFTAEDSVESVHSYLKEVARVLKSDGIFMCISLGYPSERLFVLENQDYSWQVEVFRIPKPTVSQMTMDDDDKDDETTAHYLYLCRLGGKEEG
jgi:ubiquinone/menaquinone biosynthesis C-methylase UbiE